MTQPLNKTIGWPERWIPAFYKKPNMTEYMVILDPKLNNATLYKGDQKIETVPKDALAELVDEYIPGHYLQLHSTTINGIYYMVVTE